MNPYILIKSYDRNGVLGELTEKSEIEVERFFREAHRELQMKLVEAKQRAIAEQREVFLDCSRLSGVNEGEFLRIDAKGNVEKICQPFTEVQTQLRDYECRSFGDKPCKDLGIARPLLARCAYNGLWSPSGTNWQPIRTVELSFQEVSSLSGIHALGCGLLVLARRRYDSILGDIAKLCRLEQASHAEEIDLGIWLLSAEQTARSHGWGLEIHTIAPDSITDFTQCIIKLLEERISCSFQLKGSAAIEGLLESIREGDHYPYCVLVPKQGPPLIIDETLPGWLQPSAFDSLIEARSTQRVASPNGELGPEWMDSFFRYAQKSISDIQTQSLCFPVFTWHDQFPKRVGQAMHDAVEGVTGLMSRANHESFISYLESCSPLSEPITQWIETEDSKREALGKKVALPAHLIPTHVRKKLLKGNVFIQRDGFIFDRRKRPLTPVLLVKLVRMILSSFVRFSLSFQNTHPLLGVVLAEAMPRDRQATYIAAGKIVAYMSFLARAHGQVSIIKSGPSEIAAPAIRNLVIQYTDDTAIRNQLGSLATDPILTFQIGLPLGPEEVVSEGQPDQHSGINERLLDKRACRASLSKHYIPVLEA